VLYEIKLKDKLCNFAYFRMSCTEILYSEILYSFFLKLLCVMGLIDDKPFLNKLRSSQFFERENKEKKSFLLKRYKNRENKIKNYGFSKLF